MDDVTLVYTADCPNLEAARQALRAALGEAGWPPEWREWEASDARLPAAYRGYPSPTVLVGNRDVMGATPGPATACAVGGAPPVAAILAALQQPGR